MSKKLIFGGGAGALARQKKIKDLWTIITKKIEGMNMFKAKPKEAPIPEGWRGMQAYGDEATVKAAVAQSERIEKVILAETKTTKAEILQVEAEATLVRANKNLGQAKAGDPVPVSKAPEGTPPKGDAKPPKTEQPRADAEQPKAGAEQPKAGAEPVPAGKPEPAPGPPPKSRAERKVESKKAEVEVAGLNQQLKEMKDRVKRSKIKWGGGFLLLGGSGWYLNKAGQEYFRKNPDKLESFKAEADRLFAGDWVAVPNLVAKVLAVTPSIVGDAAGKAYKGITESLTQAGTEALNAAKEAAADGGSDKDAEAPPPEAPAAKVAADNTKGGAAPRVSDAKKEINTVSLPNTKPATLKRKSEEIPSLVVTDAISPSSANQHAAKKEVKKPPKKKDKTVPWHKGHDPITKYLEGVTGLKRSKATIAKDVAITKELDARDRDNRFARGGSVSSDSYMLRKKPKTTSEVKKGSRQSRSWNY